MFSPAQPARTDMAVTLTTAYWLEALTLPDPGLVHGNRARLIRRLYVFVHMCAVLMAHRNHRPFWIPVMLMLWAWDLSLTSCRSCAASFIFNYLFVCILVPIWSHHAFRVHCPILKKLFISCSSNKTVSGNDETEELLGFASGFAWHNSVDSSVLLSCFLDTEVIISWSFL